MRIVTILLIAVFHVATAPAQTTPLAPPPLPDVNAYASAVTQLETATTQHQIAQRNMMADAQKNRQLFLTGMAALAGETKSLTDKETAAATTALDNMGKGTDFVVWAEKTLEIEQVAQLTTNAWSDVQFRNAFDRTKHIVTTAGSAVAAVAFLQKNPTTRRWVGTLGLGSVSLSQLLGLALGKEKGNFIAEKTGFLSLTVRAYDDLVARNQHLNNFITADTTFGNDVAKLRADFDAATVENKVQFVGKILGLMERYDDVLRHYPTSIQEIQDVHEQYITTLSDKDLPESTLFKTLRDKLNTVASKASDLKKFYGDKILMNLQVNQEAKRVLQLADLQRAAGGE